MTNKVRISGAIASKTSVTLYLENGEEMNLPNDSWKTKTILDHALAPLARHEIVEIDLDTFSIEQRIEHKTGGLLRFVKTTFSKIGSLFGTRKEEPKKEWPETWTEANPSKVLVSNPAPTPVESSEVVDTNAPKIDPKAETLVAVVDGKAIPGVEALAKHMEHAVKTDNYAGLQRFMERIAKVSIRRAHTVQELLNFMKRGDLPIADDGSIIAYKVLTTTGNSGKIADCHSRKVFQRVGSFVSMDEKLVDASRRTECSTGLHIARRGYIRAFTGNVIMLVKIAPEDVIAVPYSEPDKMRVAGYHIIFQLPTEAHVLLRSNQPMTSNAIASKMLADAISGNHIGIIEYVKINAARGGDVVITPVTDGKKAPRIDVMGDGAKALDDLKAVDIRELRRKTEEAQQAAAATTVPVETKSEPALVAAPISVPIKDPTTPSVTKTETKAERDARKKREKRAAEKAAKEARQGVDPNYGEPMTVPARKAKPLQKTPVGYDLAKVPENYRKAIKAVFEGMSKREAERKFGISARTIGRYLK